jgi:hypothetical protein
MATTHRDYVTDLDFTTTTDFDAATLAGKKPLRQFGTNNVEGFSDNYIFGEYRGPMEDTGGHNFHIFPDGIFVVEAFCDICQRATAGLTPASQIPQTNLRRRSVPAQRILEETKSVPTLRSLHLISTFYPVSLFDSLSKNRAFGTSSR